LIENVAGYWTLQEECASPEADLAGGDKIERQEIEIHQADSLATAAEVAGVIADLWGPNLAPPELLRALATHGNPIFGAYVSGRIVGGQMSFLALGADELHLHSHITGVLPEFQHSGVGAALKIAQHDWCVDRGIDLVTWTFDPMLARNAYFNFEKLGCVSNTFHPNFYGSLDDDFNRNDRSDRLEVRWEVTSQRVLQALAGRREHSDDDDAFVLLNERGERTQGEPSSKLSIHVPYDYLSLRSADPERATRWRSNVAEAFEWAFGRGYRIVAFTRSGAYILTDQGEG
jgi:predicted GNAT superfamily acetyltransferase